MWSDIIRTIYDPINVKKARFSAFYSMPKETQALYNLREEDGFCEPKESTKKFKKGVYSEKDLEDSLVAHLEQFILELGNGFCFAERQKRMIIDGEDL